MQFFDAQLQTKLEQINKNYEHICELLGYEEVIQDKNLCKKLELEKKLYQPIVSLSKQILNLSQELDSLMSNQHFDNESEKQLFKEEIVKIQQKLVDLKAKLVNSMATLNGTTQNITIEITKNSGELSSKLFEDILNGYQNFCKANRLCYQVEENKNGATIMVSGLNAKEYFKDENGIHLASFENKNGSCNVVIYDLYEIEELNFKDEDIKIDVFRSNGAGGQNVNKVSTAIRVTHLKTGIVSVCQDERSQFQNKNKAINNLKEKVERYYENKKQKYIKEQKKESIKLLQQNYVAKTYNYNTNKIITKEKAVFDFADFISGNIL